MRQTGRRLAVNATAALSVDTKIRRVRKTAIRARQKGATLPDFIVLRAARTRWPGQAFGSRLRLQQTKTCRCCAASLCRKSRRRKWSPKALRQFQALPTQSSRLTALHGALAPRCLDGHLIRIKSGSGITTVNSRATDHTSNLRIWYSGKLRGGTPAKRL